jgi:hypothetical protein
MRNRFRNDAGNPLQPGNALKNGNFDKAFFRFNGIALTLTLIFVGLAVLYFM